MNESVFKDFGSMVFNDKVMKERLPEKVYGEILSAREDGKPLSIESAKIIAEAMKDWAIEKGATHYTHWFQPMTGVTAEKHDGFIEPDGKAARSISFPPNLSSKASRTRRVCRPAVFARPSKRADIPRGIPRLTFS